SAAIRRECGMDRGPRRHPMLRYRIAAGGLALLPALVVNASAQNCLLPWACQDSQPSRKAWSQKLRMQAEHKTSKITCRREKDCRVLFGAIYAGLPRQDHINDWP